MHSVKINSKRPKLGVPGLFWGIAWGVSSIYSGREAVVVKELIKNNITEDLNPEQTACISAIRNQTYGWGTSGCNCCPLPPQDSPLGPVLFMLCTSSLSYVGSCVVHAIMSNHYLMVGLGSDGDFCLPFKQWCPNPAVDYANIKIDILGRNPVL